MFRRKAGFRGNTGTLGLQAALVLTLAVAGCQTTSPSRCEGPTGVVCPAHAPCRGAAQCSPCTPVPRELSKVVLPAYSIEPPDILVIDAIHIVPKPPYHLRTLDVLSVQVQGTLPESPISGAFPVEPGGMVRLGVRYGAVKVSGMTVEEAEKAITKHLHATLSEPQVSVSLVDTAAKQQIAGQHLVGPDGTVTLGSYGSVSVVGLTIAQAKSEIEQYLARFLEGPEISLDVFAYNSKVYYIVTQGGGMGDGVFRFPVTGNETVLDAIAQINGLQQVASKKIWIARPTDEPGKTQILPVKWEDITADAHACSNYQVLPGDRVFIADDKWIALDTGLGKIIAPVERVMGFSILGASTATRFSGKVLAGGGNPGGGGF